MPGGYSYLGDFRIEESGGAIVSQSVGSKALMSEAADASTLKGAASRRASLGIECRSTPGHG